MWGGRGFKLIYLEQETSNSKAPRHFRIWINPVKAAELHSAFNNLIPPSASSCEMWTWSIWTLPLRLLAASPLSSLPLNNNIPTVSPRQRRVRRLPLSCLNPPPAFSLLCLTFINRSSHKLLPLAVYWIAASPQRLETANISINVNINYESKRNQMTKFLQVFLRIYNLLST